jgi:ribosome-associated protein
LRINVNTDSMSANRASLDFLRTGSVGRFLFPGDTPITIQSPAAPIDLTDRRAASRQLASLAAKAAEELKGKETVVLDLTAVTPIMDFFVITTATSGRQMRAIAEEVEMLMKANGNRPRVGVEGRESETWILQDYGDIVLHVLSAEGRELYDLEHLWADAPQVDWKTEAASIAAVAAG